MESLPLTTPVSDRVNRLFPLLLVLFAASGAAGLIYEIVWLQLLQLVVGSSAVSLAVLLGTFMGGMCLGSILFSRVVSSKYSALRVYAVLEIATAAFGVLVLFGLPLLQHVYVAAVTGGMPNMLLRGFACAICLLPPTLLMGATLPAIARWVASTPNAAVWWGYFYGTNIAGGVIGCILAGFYLLRVFDMSVATAVAAVLNVVVALGALAIERMDFALPEQSSGVEAETGDEPGGSRMAIYLATALSGLGALGAEVVWTRILALMLGPTTYTFSIILGVFLTGLGLGSAAGARLAEKKGHARLRLGLSQLLLCVLIAFSAYMLSQKLPYFQGNVDSVAGPWKDFLGDVWRTTLAVFLPALLWGASFPLALAAAARKDSDPAKLVGGIYGANTIGAILGSILFSLVFLPAFGSRASEQMLIGIALVGGLIVLNGLPQISTMRLAASIVLATVLAWTIPGVPWKLVGFGRRLPTTSGNWELLSLAEGTNSSAAWSRWESGTVYFHVSGKVEASTEPQDMSLQRMLGHLPALLHPEPKSVLIVGFGAGVTAGSFVLHPTMQHITICEIEPNIPPNSDKYFGKENYHVYKDPRTIVHYDDARHFILTGKEKFDIITSDPIHPFVKGMASLYTTEYFEMCKRRLNPGGFVTQWVPLYETSMEAAKSEIATFFEAFPNGTIWGNVNTDGQGYDLVLLGQVEPLKINPEQLQQRLDRPDHARIKASLGEAGYSTGLELLSTYAAGASDLREWVKTAQINRDRNLRLQFLAGLGVNSNLAGPIYDEMMSAAKFPDDMVLGSPESIAAMKATFHRRRF
ncbi:MAG: Spermine synthase [Bryobacterales bacterium]|nr:Spermine synthase [Bryobacterales bacterium]